MTKEEFKTLQEARRDLERLVELYELACADIAPPIKVLDGMPYSLTNAIHSMTESKAVRLEYLYQQIEEKSTRVRLLLGNLDKIPRDDIRQAIVLRFLCCYDWQTVKDKTHTKLKRETLRMLCNYYIKRKL